jgi:hypothetical protein
MKDTITIILLGFITAICFMYMLKGIRKAAQDKKQFPGIEPEAIFRTPLRPEPLAIRDIFMPKVLLWTIIIESLLSFSYFLDKENELFVLSHFPGFLLCFFAEPSGKLEVMVLMIGTNLLILFLLFLIIFAFFIKLPSHKIANKTVKWTK